MPITRIRRACGPSIASYGDVRQEDIVDIDVLWTSEGAETLVPASVDYVIASHVIEHVPDLIGWLEEIRRVLRPDGTVRLAIPDRRFTFDFLRKETRLADIVNANLLGAKVPLPLHILDHFLHASHVDLLEAWSGRMDPDSLLWAHSKQDSLSVARNAMEQKTYHDVHCWVFTPRSFGELFERAARLGFVKFKLEQFHDTAPGNLEFFVAMTPCDDQEEAARGWRTMREAAAELPLDELTFLRGERNELASQVARLTKERQALLSSTSWKLTTPLRALKMLFR